MARWTGTWLEGPQYTLREMRDPEGWAGKKLGFPREGTGSLAPFSVRAAGFAVDVVSSGVLSFVLVQVLDHPSPWTRQWASVIVLVLEQVLLVALTGATLGMRLMGTTVLRLSDESKVPGLAPALVRTALLVVTGGLAAVFSKDGRGLHDVAARSAVVRRDV